MAAKFTFAQFKTQYPDDDACLQAIFDRRYEKRDVCPKCGVIGTLTKIEGRRAYACKEGCHTYPCVGTIFEHSSTTLTLWFHAMYLLTATRNGVAAKELQRQLGVTYKCAWRIGHQLRDLMSARDKATTPGVLSNHVEVDEAFIGGKIRGKRDGKKRTFDNKTVVMGLLERNGALKGRVVDSAKKIDLLPVIQECIEPGTMVNTDNYSAYRDLRKYGFRHESVNHSAEEWVRGNCHTNGIEGFWSH